MLWPFVRAAGDCLTDAELAAGHTGVYNGPTNTNVDVSAIKPDPALQNNAVSSGNSGGNGLFEGSLFNGSFFSGGLFGSDSPTVARPGVGACNKGAFWPFYREPGDCLTDQEKKEGHTGVYHGEAVVTQVNAATGTAPQAAGTVPLPTATAPSAAVSVQACRKGWLWPFIRDSGDCPTVIERSEGRTGAYGGSPAITQVSATPAQTPQAAPTSASPTPTATPPAASTPACSKGLFWPFVKSAGDCPTDTEKSEGHTAAYSSNPSVTPVNASPADMPRAAGTTAAPAAATSTMPPVASAPACNKGWLWPFVKSAGDCPTDAEKK
jgi:hypothetical protein